MIPGLQRGFRRRPAGGGGGGSDPDYSSVALLVKANGADGSQDFIDAGPTGHSLTVDADCDVDTGITKWGSGSIEATDYQAYVEAPSHADFDMGTGDFTIEYWFYPATTGPTGRVHWAFSAFASIYGEANGNALYAYNVGAPHLSFTGLGTVTAWHHVAIVRSSGTTTLYYDGVAKASGANSTDITQGAFVVSNNRLHQLGTGVEGQRIEDFRLTKGVARYTGTFTPPASEFPTS